MLLIKLEKIKKYYGDRLIFDIDNLEILENQRIGIVGENGVGKSTLIKVILGIEEAPSGNIYLNNSYEYISQTDEGFGKCNDGKVKRILGAPDVYSEFLSGGEKMKLKIARALGSNSKLLIADEPTANLDSNSIKIIERMIEDYKGSLLLVSHDRGFLDKLCDSILEIENGKVKLYKGNYSKYIELKELENDSSRRGYNKYVSERKRLEDAIAGKETSKNSIRKTPKRMGNSEARLHKMGGQKGKKKLDGNIKALKSRIEHLEVKEKPIVSKEIRIKVNDDNKMLSRTVFDVKDLNITVGDKLLLTRASFKITNGKKVGVIGDNGSGKTTLIKNLINGHIDNIRVSKYLKVGYFDQNQDILDGSKSIIENIIYDSSYDEGFIRINLDGFGFKGEDVFKKVESLSGGEKVKVALCKIILSDNNTLILDEPTNYLDIKSIKALEDALKSTDKTIIVVSHDRHFLSMVCNSFLELKDKNAQLFNGSYNDFINEKTNLASKLKESKDQKECKEKIMLLENKLSEIISKISFENCLKTREDLDQDYQNLLIELKRTREKLL